MLFAEIEREYRILRELFAQLPLHLHLVKEIPFQDRLISSHDLIAYQIGWGKAVIRWYEAGLSQEMPVMPGEGFTTWDYKGLAAVFYQKYQNVDELDQVVQKILAIVQKEEQLLDKEGVWPWCQLPSGKQWPLGKWIRVNTCAPYKRAAQLLRKLLKHHNL